jgi:hypothetical protein
VVENISRSLPNFEPVHGQSLNDLYKTAYVHYLQNDGNPSRNAATVFYFDRNWNISIEDVRGNIKIELKKLI